MPIKGFPPVNEPNFEGSVFSSKPKKAKKVQFTNSSNLEGTIKNIAASPFEELKMSSTEKEKEIQIEPDLNVVPLLKSKSKKPKKISLPTNDFTYTEKIVKDATIERFEELKKPIPGKPFYETLFLPESEIAKKPAESGKEILKVHRLGPQLFDENEIEEAMRDNRFLLHNAITGELFVSPELGLTESYSKFIHLQIIDETGEAEDLVPIQIQDMTGEQAFYLSRAVNQLLRAFRAKRNQEVFEQKNDEKDPLEKIEDKPQNIDLHRSLTSSEEQLVIFHYLMPYKPKDRARLRAIEHRRQQQAIEAENSKKAKKKENEAKFKFLRARIRSSILRREDKEFREKQEIAEKKILLMVFSYSKPTNKKQPNAQVTEIS